MQPDAAASRDNCTWTHTAVFFSSRCSIADVNQALVDDSLVDKEKIGGSNYFW